MNMGAGANLRILSTTAMKTVLERLAPQFEQDSTHTLDLTFGPSGGLTKRIADGEAADVLICAQPEMSELQRQGRIAFASAVIARSNIGVAVRKGAPRPDISSPEAFKRALIAANSVAFSDPARGGASGVTFVKILERLGIADAVKAKAKLTAGGPDGLVGAILSRGEAEIGVQQIPGAGLVRRTLISSAHCRTNCRRRRPTSPAFLPMRRMPMRPML